MLRWAYVVVVVWCWEEGSLVVVVVMVVVVVVVVVVEILSYTASITRGGGQTDISVHCKFQ
jgi:hypothetical protein